MIKIFLSHKWAALRPPQMLNRNFAFLENDSAAVYAALRNNQSIAYNTSEIQGQSDRNINKWNLPSLFGADHQHRASSLIGHFIRDRAEKPPSEGPFL